MISGEQLCLRKSASRIWANSMPKSAIESMLAHVSTKSASLWIQSTIACSISFIDLCIDC